MAGISVQETDMKELSRSVNEYGSDFIDIYYKMLDSKRHELPKYYSDNCKVIWNGNEILAQNRQQFHIELPDSRHNVESFDVHPVLSEFNQKGHYMMLISVTGTSRFTGHETKLFFQNFMLEVIDSKWKIVSDCYRFAE